MTAEILERIALAAVVIVLAIILRFVLRFLIRRVIRVLLSRGPLPKDDALGARAARILARASGLAHERHKQRVGTLGSLLRNIVDVVLVVVTVLTVLAIVGVPMTPLLASAGVGGLAIGFGAQSLVKDYISGMFMLAEDQFGLGDVILVGDLKGTVLEVTMRVTKIRDGSGTVWYIRNGEILTLGNVSQGHSTATVDIPVAYDEDPEHVTSVLRRAVAGMEEEPEWEQVLLQAPSVLGVDSITGGTMTLKILVKTGPEQQYAALREVRRRAQHACQEAGVRGPAPYVPTADTA